MRLARSGGGTNKGVELPLGLAAPGRGVKEEPEPSVARYRGEAYAAGGAGSCSSREGAVGWCAAEGCGAGAPLVGARRTREWRGRRRRLVGGGRGRAMALLLCLGLTAALARGCLHCHGNFSDKFSFYRHHVNLKSWWVGDIPVSGSLLSDWSQDTMKELHLAIPAEISECGGPARAEPPARPGPDPGGSHASFSRPSPGEAEPSGGRRVPEDGSTLPGKDVLPG